MNAFELQQWLNFYQNANIDLVQISFSLLCHCFCYVFRSNQFSKHVQHEDAFRRFRRWKNLKKSKRFSKSIRMIKTKLYKIIIFPTKKIKRFSWYFVQFLIRSLSPLSLPAARATATGPDRGPGLGPDRGPGLGPGPVRHVEEKLGEQNFQVFREMQGNNLCMDLQKWKVWIKFGWKCRNRLRQNLKFRFVENLNSRKIKNDHFKTWNWIAILNLKARHLMSKFQNRFP